MPRPQSVKTGNILIAAAREAVVSQESDTTSRRVGIAAGLRTGGLWARHASPDLLIP